MGEGLFRKLLLGGTLTASLAFYLYELVQKNPDQSFALLRQFGPSFLVTIVALVLLWDLVKVGVTNVGRLADSMQVLSTAVAQIAEKDDRQFEEMRRLCQFAAQQGERNFEILREQAETLKRIESSIANAKTG